MKVYNSPVELFKKYHLLLATIAGAASALRCDGGMDLFYGGLDMD